MNYAPGEKAAGQPKGIDDPVGRFVHQMHSSVSPRMRSWESPEREPALWGTWTSRARSQPPDLRILKTIRGGKEANAWAADYLRQAIRPDSGGSNYTMLFLWIKFWSNGGRASLAELNTFLQGLQEMSEADSLVLGIVVYELQSS
ncbi:hypothetical protein [Arthrobacter sp. I3]|uniref:hypothetical protein n=1 Tax=Arthrobacter sp. I3 TaxID=218158 RepID=UPI0004851DA2|nr:hypothetical protein [Arthrobacter sp. I3]